jgi:hypothetical protein
MAVIASVLMTIINWRVLPWGYLALGCWFSLSEDRKKPYYLWHHSSTCGTIHNLNSNQLLSHKTARQAENGL